MIIPYIILITGAIVVVIGLLLIAGAVAWLWRLVPGQKTPEMCAHMIMGGWYAFWLGLIAAFVGVVIRCLT